jgi:hypothetical protein
MNKVGIGIGIAFLVGLGLLLFFTRKAPASPETGCATCGQPLRLQLAAPGESTKGLLHYKNTERRRIQWNEDMVPVEIVIEREYYQLP